jgi:CBS domain containing-hemolysin-like protein
MNLQFDWIVWFASMALLALHAGTYSALAILSCARIEKTGEENGGQGHFIDRLLETPQQTELSLSAGKGLFIVFTVITSLRISAKLLSDQDFAIPLTALIVGGSVLVPLLVARVMAVRHPERFIVISKPFILTISLILKPLVLAAQAVLGRLSPKFLDALAIQIIPLKQKIEMIDMENGYLEKEERELMTSIFDFGDTKVREVMIPRIDMVAVDLSTGKEEALDTIMGAGLSRIPVYEGTIDRIIGMVYTKDLLKKIVSENDFSLGDILREVFFVPESKMIDDLLTEFKKRRKHIAIAVDEYGGTAGLVTLEDILEELVGDIQDEFDEEEELVERIDEDTVVCNAKVHLDELNEILGLNLDEESVESLGGFLYGKIGRVPRVGDVVPHDGVTYEIQSVLRQRIDKVVIKGLKSIKRDLEH